MFKIYSESEKNSARTGKLKTRHGIANTPFFMPVATKAGMKHVTTKGLVEMNAEAIISNAFILYMRPGDEFIKKMGGIHEFMGFQKTIFTDSGGFQVLDKDFLISVNNKGVRFKNPYSKQELFLSPENVIDYQINIKSDVAMVLDDVPRYGKNKTEFSKSLERTHEWAKRAKGYHNDKKQLLFGITQGGTFSDLRKKSAKVINSLDFDGIALGGLCIGETKKTMHKIIDVSLKELNHEKPRYLMGVGSPAELIESVYQGIDIFDSIFPTKNARHQMLFTDEGPLKINHSKYRFDKKPIEKNCNCYVCKNHSRAYLRYLFKIKDTLGYMLASYHNTYYIQKLMKKIRKNINQGTYDNFRKTFLKKYNTR